MFKWMATLLVLIFTFQFSSISYAETDDSLKVAFIRGGHLWVKVNAKEMQVTTGYPVLAPRWSYDGQYIAYAKGTNADDIWVYHLKTKQHVHIYSGAHHYGWAPSAHVLAFQIDEVLNTAELHSDSIGKLNNVSLGVGNYSWMPDGSGFLVSSNSKLLPTGWTPVELFLVPADAHLDSNKIKPFFTLPSESAQFFAVSTSSFKWSSDGKWISFLAIPTASLSADSNTLCVLSADASKFKQLGNMLHYDSWFQWAPSKNLLAYIEGEGRVVLENKHLKIKELPILTPLNYTPQGDVDRDLTWNTNQLLTVSRSKEINITTGTVKCSFPALFQVNLLNHKQQQITNPPIQTGDYYPYQLSKTKKLTWIRADDKQASAWIAGSNGTNPQLLIKNIDHASSYYDYSNWASVIAWYDPFDVHNTVLGEPSYAKWGQLAMKEVGKKYDAQIVDYLHVGRTQINAQTTKETFKFWLRGENREFGVYVTIQFQTSTDKVLSVEFQESDR